MRYLFVGVFFLPFLFLSAAHAGLLSTALGNAPNTPCSNTGTTSAVCSGSYTTPQGNDGFSSSASTSYTDFYDTATTASAQFDSVAASASSSSSDAIVLGGQSGTAYADFTLYYYSQGVYGSASAQFNGTPVDSNLRYSNVVVPVTFNDPFSLSLSSQVSSVSPEGGTYAATFEIVQVELFADAGLQDPINNYTYSAGSGAIYPFLGGAAVPEPSSAFLMTGGLVFAAFLALASGHRGILLPYFRLSQHSNEDPADH